MFEFVVMISRYAFILYMVYFLWLSAVYIMDERGARLADRRSAVSQQRFAIFYMHITAFFILAYLPGTNFMFNTNTLLVGAAGIALLCAAHFLVDKMYKKGCPLMWNSVFFLLDLGFIALYRLNPGLALRQGLWFLLGLGVIAALPLGLKMFAGLIGKFTLIYGAVGFGLLILPFITGERIYGSLNWANIAGFTFQPSELSKVLFVFFLAGAFQEAESHSRWLMPSAVSAAYVLVLVFQNNLGGALIFFMTYLSILFMATGKALLSGAIFLTAAMATIPAYHQFAHLRVRVAAWYNPWADIDRGGYQIAQSLFAIGTWGFGGSGLTMGNPRSIPVVERDFIFSAIAEEFGTIFAIGVILIFVLLLYRGMHFALACRQRLHSLLAAGLTALLAFQTFLILGGVTKLIPLTGVTLPFMSYGGSSVLVSIMIIAFLQWGGEAWTS